VLLPSRPLQRVVGVQRRHRVQRLAVVCFLALLGFEVDCSRDILLAGVTGNLLCQWIS
jgi:hypothetical protein